MHQFINAFSISCHKNTKKEEETKSLGFLIIFKVRDSLFLGDYTYLCVVNMNIAVLV